MEILYFLKVIDKKVYFFATDRVCKSCRGFSFLDTIDDEYVTMKKCDACFGTGWEPLILGEVNAIINEDDFPRAASFLNMCFYPENYQNLYSRFSSLTKNQWCSLKVHSYVNGFYMLRQEE
jgi:hypothetical protein